MHRVFSFFANKFQTLCKEIQGCLQRLEKLLLNNRKIGAEQ